MLTPAAVHRLETIHDDNRGAAETTTQLPSAQQQTDVARAAVEQPRAEQDAHAQHDLIAAVDERPPPSPEIEAACARIRQVIQDKRPASEDKLVEARPREMAQAAGQEMSAGVEQRAGTVRQGFADMQQQPSGKPTTVPVPATVPPGHAQTPPVDAATGVSDPLRHEDVSLDGDLAAQRRNIQDAGMNTEAGQLVNDGPIGDARSGASELETAAKTDPQKVLADQAAAIAKAQSDMRALQAAAEKALADARAGAVSQMATHTTGVKGSEEQQRAAAGAQMQAVFARTQRTIDGLLSPLGRNAVARWEAGIAQLSTEFESRLAGVKQKIEERHSGVLGGITAVGDGLFGLPLWVTVEYDVAEARFGDGATSLITEISRDVNAVIENCKKLIEQARKDIDAVVKSLPANLQSWAQGEASRLGQELDQLGQKVDQTQQGLDQDLVNRANGAVQEVRERVADLREQAKGLIGKIADAIAAFAKDPGRAIVNGLLRILGIPPASFWALIEKLGDVIGGIAAAPLKFANTLMAGVGQGFQQFFTNLPAHLGQALFQWLFGKLGEAGVQMPADFSMKGILTVVLEVMGVTWTRIKTLLAKHIGAQNAGVLDQAMQLVTALIEKGPEGVFELIKDQLDPSMILDAIKDAVIQYVMQAIITRVTARILMMLNPAGAILQAIEAIYRVIKWVIDNAARIFTLLESIVNGAAQILAGNVSGVAALVESSLVRLIVPVIDFLAGYLGLGGIPGAIKNVILGLQQRVEAILDKVIGFIAQKAKGMWAAMKNRGKAKAAAKVNGTARTDRPGTSSTASSNSQPSADKRKTSTPARAPEGAGPAGSSAKSKGKPGAQKLDTKPIVERFTMHGEPHQLIVQLGPAATVDMASRRQRLSVKVGHAVGKLIAGHAPPEQIADLKRIGALAKNGDAMVAKATKPGTTTIAQHIAAYGNKWVVKDLHEVTVKAEGTVVATGTMKGEGHKLTIDLKNNKILLASVEADALVKVQDALDKVRKIKGPTKEAETALGDIKKTLSELGTMLSRRVQGNAASAGAKGNELMQAKAEQVMKALHDYGAKFGVHDVGELPTFTADADYERMATTAGSDRLDLAIASWEKDVSGSLFREDASEIWVGWKLANPAAIKAPAIAVLKKAATDLKADGIQKVQSLAAGTGSDLSAGKIKPEFHRAAGEPAAAQAKTYGLAKATKADTKTAINNTHYVVGAGTYGEIDTPKGKPVVDSKLKAAVGGNIIGFLKSMALQGAANGMTLAEFETAWAVQVNTDWVKDRFRDAAPRMHEWIPCEKIVAVINVARSAADAAHKVAWIELHHILRSPTKTIIFSPSGAYGTYHKIINGNNVQVLCGHSGNLHVILPPETEPVPCTGNQNLWHTALGNLFDPSKSIGQTIDAIEAFFRQTVWDGSGSLPAGIYKDYVDTGGKSIPWNTIAASQKKCFDDIVSDFAAARSQLSRFG